MNIEQLSDKLRPWMQVETWHTTHPLDYQRFHKSLESAFLEYGSSISYDDLKEAMLLLAEEMLSGELENKYLEEAIDRFSSHGEVISGFISDVGLYQHNSD